MTTNDNRRFEQAIASGEKNKRTMELVRNWCKHARVAKFGGTGQIEMETGLPIGTHYVACDHAPAGGLASWDLADSALDFHDRNCAHCEHREPVQLPNLSSLLAERDEIRRLYDEERHEAEERQNKLRATRKSIRQALRSQLNAVSATIIDHLSELDSESPADAAQHLIGMASLAPETFTREIQEHLFLLLEAREHWFDEVGLRILDTLGADPPRLVKCALLSLEEHSSIELAANIVKTRPQLIPPTLLPGAIPTLVWLAYPEHQIGMSERILDPAPLITAFRAFGSVVESAIADLLSQRDPALVSAGARAIEILAPVDRTLPSRHTRAAAAKLARAHLLIDHRDTGYLGDDEAIHHLQQVLALALETTPEQSDTLIANFIAGAASEGEVRLYKAYGIVLGGRRRRNERPQSPAAAIVALNRLLSAATRSTNEEVLREISATISYVDDGLSAVGRSELSALLGTAALIDDRIEQVNQKPTTDTSFIGSLERNNHLNLLFDLQDGLVKWAAAAASGEINATTQYVDFLERIPEGQDRIRRTLIKNAVALMDRPEGLNTVLPALYTAMLGSSVLVRASGAEAIGKLSRRSRDDIPKLVYEAFVVLLGDPYIAVHKSAVRALEHLELPSQLDDIARTQLVGWIQIYAASHADNRFLLECIGVLLRKYLTADQKRGRPGQHLLTLLNALNADLVAERISWIRHDFLETEGFPELVVKLLEECESPYRLDDLLRTVDALPDQAIYSQKARIESVATADHAEHGLPSKLVEILTRAGAWNEAARITQVIYDKIPNTTEKRVQKLAANLDRIATRYEATIADGRLDLLPGLAAEWRTTETDLERHRLAHARFTNPFSDFPGSN